MTTMAQRLVRRLGKALPPDIQSFARAVRASRNSSAIVELPKADSVVVVGAHPDDETALAGGTIALLAAQGSRITVVLATAGEGTTGPDIGTDQIRRKRVAEAGVACQILGASEPVILGYADGSVAEHFSNLVADLGEVIARERPQLVFAPWWLDDHPDHRAVAAAVIEADIPDDVLMWFGEIWTPLIPNRIVNITETIELKRRALAAHETAGDALDLEAFLGLNRYRSVRGLRGAGFAEAFLVATPEAARALVTGPDV
jgi:LmbE family N-acetylglucosaminyl deacetylase